MIIIGISVIVIAILAVQFKTVKTEYSIFISLAGCVLIFGFSLSRINDIVKIFEMIKSWSWINNEYIKILLKIMGIAFITEIASDIAKDCGFTALANQSQILGKLSILAVSIPIFLQLFTSVGELLS